MLFEVVFCPTLDL